MKPHEILVLPAKGPRRTKSDRKTFEDGFQQCLERAKDAIDDVLDFVFKYSSSAENSGAQWRQLHERLRDDLRFEIDGLAMSDPDEV